MIQYKQILLSPARAMLMAALLASGLLFSACFSSPDPACAFSCGQNNACPENYRCVSDGWCKRNDVADDFVCSATPLFDASSVSDSALVDGAEVDASAMDAALPDAALPDAALPDAALPDAALPDAM